MDNRILINGSESEGGDGVEPNIKQPYRTVIAAGDKGIAVVLGKSNVVDFLAVRLHLRYWLLGLGNERRA